MCAQVRNGETFISETDTEVVPKLCRYLYRSLGKKIPFPKVGDNPYTAQPGSLLIARATVRSSGSMTADAGLPDASCMPSHEAHPCMCLAPWQLVNRICGALHECTGRCITWHTVASCARVLASMVALSVLRGA